MTVSKRPVGEEICLPRYEADEEHEERRTGLAKPPDLNRITSSFVLFLSFVVGYLGATSERY